MNFTQEAVRLLIPEIKIDMQEPNYPLDAEVEITWKNETSMNLGKLAAV